MKLGQSVSTCMRKYAVFSGRASRSEYWWFAFFTLIFRFVVQVVGTFVEVANSGNGLITIVISIIIFLALLPPSLAVSVRRLHDLDKSGWFFFVFIIPLIGVIVMLIWCCSRGTDGTNRFGEDPLLRQA